MVCKMFNCYEFLNIPKKLRKRWTKPTLINDWENTIAYWEQSEQSEGLGKRLNFKYNCGSGEWCNPRKILYFFFFPSFKFGQYFHPLD